MPDGGSLARFADGPGGEGRPDSLVTARDLAPLGRAGWSDIVRPHAVTSRLASPTGLAPPPTATSGASRLSLRHPVGWRRTVGGAAQTSVGATDDPLGSVGGFAAEPAAGARSSRGCCPFWAASRDGVSCPQISTTMGKGNRQSDSLIPPGWSSAEGIGSRIPSSRPGGAQLRESAVGSPPLAWVGAQLRESVVGFRYSGPLQCALREATRRVSHLRPYAVGSTILRLDCSCPSAGSPTKERSGPFSAVPQRRRGRLDRRFATRH